MEAFAQTLKRTELELNQEAESDGVECQVLDEFDGWDSALICWFFLIYLMFVQ